MPVRCGALPTSSRRTGPEESDLASALSVSTIANHRTVPTVRLKRNTNGLYYVRLYDPTRTPREKAIPTGTRNRRNAETHRSRIEREVSEGVDHWLPRVAGAPAAATFQSAAALFLRTKAQHVRPATIAAYRMTLSGAGALLPPGIRVDGLTPTHLLSYILDRSVSDATRRFRYRHLRSFFRWCIGARIARTNPLDEVRMPKAGRRTPAFLSTQDLGRLLGEIEKAGITWLADVVRFTVCTGLRRGEVCALTWSGVDLTPGTEAITIRSREQGFQTKSGNDHVVPLYGDALTVVRRLAQRGATEDAPVFTGQKGRPLYPNYVTHRFKDFARQAGLPKGVHFHSLRHTCGTWLTRAGAPLPVVSRILGHSSVQVTQIYAHAAQEDLRAFGQAAFGASRSRRPVAKRRRSAGRLLGVRPR
jgi:integrase